MTALPITFILALVSLAMHHQAPLLSNRRFLPLFCTQFLGAFNDNFLKNAIVILITYQSLSVWNLSTEMMSPVAAGLFIFPFFLFSALAGQIADKYEKSRLIRWIKLFEILLMVIAGLGFFLRLPALLMIVLLFMGVHSTFFGPIKYSILPQLLQEEQLVAGNAWVEMGTNLAILLGTMIGGMLIDAGPHGTIYVSCILVTVAVAGWGVSRRIPRVAVNDAQLPIRWNPIPPTLEMIRLSRQNRSVFLSILGISWFWLFGVVFLALFPPYVKTFLGANEQVATLFLAVFCIGIGLGSLICEKLSYDRLELGLVPFGSLGMTIFAIDLCISGRAGIPVSSELLSLSQFLGSWGGIRILADLLLLALFSGFYIVPLYTLIQERSDPQHRSRIIAANNILNAIFMVAGSGILVGLFSLKLSIPKIFLIVALANAGVAIYIYTLIPEFFLRFLMYLLTHVLYRLRAEGTKNIPAEGAAVLVCNHVSFVDWLILSAAIKRPIRFVMDLSYAKLPFFKMLLRQAKVIPITSAKENPVVLAKAFDKVAEELQDGNLVCIFPEGRLTSDGGLQSFRPGVEKAIERTPVPVVPMALQGMWGSFFSRKGGKAMRRPFRRVWSRLQLVIGEAIPPDQATAALLQQKVQELLGE